MLSEVRKDYDYLIVDCSPSLGLLTVNALTAADEVLIPLLCEYLAMRGLRHLNRAIESVKSRLNPKLRLSILRTFYQKQTIHSKDVSDEVESVFKGRVYNSIIKKTIKFADSSVAGEPILSYAKSSQAAQSYRDLAKEVMKDG